MCIFVSPVGWAMEWATFGGIEMSKLQAPLLRAGLKMPRWFHGLFRVSIRAPLLRAGQRGRCLLAGPGLRIQRDGSAGGRGAGTPPVAFFSTPLRLCVNHRSDVRQMIFVRRSEAKRPEPAKTRACSTMGLFAGSAIATQQYIL